MMRATEGSARKERGRRDRERLVIGRIPRQRRARDESS